MSLSAERQKGGMMEQNAANTGWDQEMQDREAQSNRSHEQIAALAYALWQERGCPEGSPEVDWFKAEALAAEEELKASASAAGQG
jgi:hypothetical protein